MKHFHLYYLVCLISFGCASPQVPKVESPTAKNSVYYYLLSEMEMYRNRPKESLENLTRAIEKDPTQSYLWYKRAFLYALMGEIKKSEDDVVKSLEINPEEISSLILFGKIRQGQQKWSEAVSCYQKALKTEPGSEEAHSLLTEVYVAQKDYRMALESVRLWKKNDPENLAPLFYKASLYQDFLKNPRAAVGAYENILEIDSENLKAMTALADLYVELKDENKLLEIFKSMEAVSPNDTSIKVKIALIYYEHKQYDQAIEEFQALLQMNPGDDRIIYYLGVMDENLNRDQKAITQFEKIKTSSNYYKDASLHLAFLKRRGGKEEEAIQILQSSLKAKPDASSLYQYLSEIYREHEDYKQALEVLKKGIGKTSDKEQLLYLYGVTQDKSGQFEEAMKTMRKVMAMNPKNPSPMNYIGYSYADRCIHLEEAQNLVQKALALKPEDGFIMDSLGWVYYQKGDLDKALHFISKAYLLVPKEATIVEHLGDVYLKKKEKKEALKYFREAEILLEAILKKKDKDQTHPEGGEGVKDFKRVRKKIEEIQ